MINKNELNICYLRVLNQLVHWNSDIWNDYSKGSIT